MKKKKHNLLLPPSKCCLKKYLDMDLISKYGSLLSILSIFLLQIYNLYTGYNFYTSLFSFFINGIFLLTVLVKILYENKYYYDRLLEQSRLIDFLSYHN